MRSVELKFGIPSIELGCSSGAKINPVSFAGHELIVLFCPLDDDAASNEIGAYLSHAFEFVRRDAWLLTFVEQRDNAAPEGRGRVLMIADPDRQAWAAFGALVNDPLMSRSDGATFLFTRGGNLHRYWKGCGHVDEVLAELATPSFEHVHQTRD